MSAGARVAVGLAVRIMPTPALSWLRRRRPASRLVAATTLDGLLDRYDIEGAELVALECAPRFLESGPSILCDLHGTDSVERVPALLRRARYDVEFVQPSCVLARPEAGSR